MTADAASLGVDIIEGTVVSAGTHFSGGTIYRNQDSAAIHGTPEAWLRDQTGREHHIRHHAVDGIREGHALVVVREASNGALLRVTNRDTRATVDLGDLVPKIGAGAVIRAILWKLFTIYLPAVFAASFLSSLAGLSDTVFGQLIGLAMNVLFFYCGYLGWRMAKDKAAHATERRAALDALFRQNGWISDTPN